MKKRALGKGNLTAALVTGAALVFGSASAYAQTSFKFAGSTDVASMDPAGRFEIFTLGFLHAIYEPLIRYDKDLKLEPALATKWEQVNPTTWRFTLREGVKFHDGSTLTADDVVFTLLRGKAEGSAMIPTLALVTEAVAVDKKTVDLKLSRPSATILNDLAFVLIMNKAWAEANGSATPTNLRANKLVPAHTQAMGTGPYKLVQRSPDVSTDLARNADWWDKPAKPLPEKVEYKPIKAASTRLAALLGGEIDFVDPVPLQDIARLKSTAGFTVTQAPELRTMFLGMDQARDELLESSVKGKNPFKDVKVRQAIYQTVDVEALKSRLMGGAIQPTNSMVGPGVIGYDASLEPRLPVDLAAAKKLMADAGYADGFTVGMDCPNDRWVNDEQVCQAVASMLSRINITVQLRAQPVGPFLGKLFKKETSFYLLGWTPGNNDALDVLKPIMSPAEGGAGFFNFGGYNNPKVTEIMKAVEVETDTPKRNAMILEGLKIHAADFGHIPLYRQYTSWAYKSSVSVVQRADGILPLWQVSVQ